jgi:glycosyltransferase involved in cell wall biosynthesis
MRVFMAVMSLRAAYGGPARSVWRTATALAETGVEVGLWASDGSARALPAGAHPACRLLAGAAREALDAFGAPSVIHDNGLWRPHNHALARLAAARGVARVVSTRGMLEPWAVAHKPLRKRAAWALYQRRDLRAARCLHATSEAEAATLARLRLGADIRVVPNGVDVPARPARAPHGAPGIRTALFLGRLYPVKGLPMLIEAWARVRPGGWRLRIAGPDEAGHRAALERLIRAAGLADHVSFAGPVDDDARAREFDEAALFVLPSHSESFGMAVAEALAHGIPVLTTTAVPWPQLGARACGWQVAPGAAAIADGLARATSLDAPALEAMGGRGRALVESDFRWDDVARRLRAIYEAVA